MFTPTISILLSGIIHQQVKTQNKEASPPFISLSFLAKAGTQREKKGNLCKFNTDNSNQSQTFSTNGTTYKIQSCDNIYHRRLEIEKFSSSQRFAGQKINITESLHGIRTLPNNDQHLPNTINFSDDTSQTRLIIWTTFGDTFNLRFNRVGIVPWTYRFTPNKLIFDSTATCITLDAARLHYINYAKWIKLHNIRAFLDTLADDHFISEHIKRLQRIKQALCPGEI